MNKTFDFKNLTESAHPKFKGLTSITKSTHSEIYIFNPNVNKGWVCTFCHTLGFNSKPISFSN